MPFKAQQENVITQVDLLNYCNCEHCMGVRKQQQESQLRWLREQQLFDR